MIALAAQASVRSDRRPLMMIVVDRIEAGKNYVVIVTTTMAAGVGVQVVVCKPRIRCVNVSG